MITQLTNNFLTAEVVITDEIIDGKSGQRCGFSYDLAERFSNNRQLAGLSGQKNPGDLLTVVRLSDRIKQILYCHGLFAKNITSPLPSPCATSDDSTRKITNINTDKGAFHPGRYFSFGKFDDVVGVQDKS